MELRLLVLGGRPAWLPPWKGGRLLVGSAPTADVSLAGSLRPFHCLVELTEGGVLVHDLARAGDVTSPEGQPVPASGMFVRAGERFSVAGTVLAVVADDVPKTEASEVPCRICGSHGAGGRTVAGVYLCPGCQGVLDVEPDTCPGYELIARLGAGGMGTVYLAHHSVLDRLVAIKLLNRASAERAPHNLNRFLREIRLLSNLQHPSIVRVFDARSVRGLIYLVSEFVPGGDALGRLRGRGTLPPQEVASIGVQLAQALDYAHGQDVIHRDVKPANVLLDGTVAKLTDFGLAKDRARATSTGSDALLGTVAYAAPEQLRDARSAGPPADVHGLAATLYHLATSRAPREGKSFLELTEKVGAPPAPACSVNAKLSRELGALLDAGLRPEPVERPPLKVFGARLATFR